MCRIAGIISSSQQPNVNSKKVKAMCDLLAHGGPDDEGLFADPDEKIVLGHRRLSIMDLSANGHQPMSDQQQKIWMVFNGEIYNFQELKEELVAYGATFHSQTDTEVIIAAYAQWGTAAFSKLRGIFAFALYDSVKNITLLVRDSYGVKPLYYHIQNNQLSFASEVKPLGKVNDIPTDPNWKIRFLAYGYVPEPFTTLKGVYNIPKGSYMCWDNQTGKYTIERYHLSFKQHTKITDLRIAEEAVRTALGKAVKRQLMADAPIGVFLSGGIDSSILTLLANEVNNSLLKTVSIYFSEKTYDEYSFQALINQKVKCEQYTHLINQKDLDDYLPQILEDMDMPTTDGINAWFISKYASEAGLKAVLSGLGADELFGGYPSFERIGFLKGLKKVPNAILRAGANFADEKFRKLSYVKYDHPVANYLFLRGNYSPEEIAGILNTTAVHVIEVLLDEHTNYSSKQFEKTDASWYEMNMYMQNQLLKNSDVMGMRHALEIRVPFLDEDFVETVQNIVPDVRFQNQLPKKLLVDSFKDILPREIWDRPKMGFTFPLQEWMRKNPMITDPALYKNKQARKALDLFNKGQVHWGKLYALYQVQYYQ
ncbi:asparagine synthase (glutamine-hydrolyzing) [Mucilaginibacter sp. RS28]|uniref:asparagine synthase (glutamine-hydrolyzing) n=1 Tax=Mucilaginibacter straminoryzae TaxID=2932774 RepID=A0A9X1X8X7_9SPHI|nr:asparagine synthase (glutamine-hydrolyzing) [Mucilaginibacter straminoryzae]MCJ8210574.1 asparagine synthase (glutamine-hydrolyzing) [Mucilaginibacter straminoryzae]